MCLQKIFLASAVFAGLCSPLVSSGEPVDPDDLDDPPVAEVPALPDPVLRLALERGEDAVFIRDGSILKGEVLGLQENLLKLRLASIQTKPEEKAPEKKETTVNWAHVIWLRSSKPLELVMNNGERFRGPVRPGDMKGSVWIRTEPAGEEVNIPIRLVREINPPPSRLKARGSVTLGGSISDGNTQTRSLSLLWDLEAKDALLRNRLGTVGAMNYGDSSGEVTARNIKGELQYDRFVMNRVYAYGSGLLQSDRFQDLDLRTVLSIGPGYQAVREGDHPEMFLEGVRWLNTLDLRGEAGLSYFIENFGSARDREFLAARWSVKLFWPVMPRLTIFHRHQGFPSLEDIEDVFITTQQGVRFQVVDNLHVSFQVNWDWDNKPATGFGRNDFVFIFGVGYNIDLKD